MFFRYLGLLLTVLLLASCSSLNPRVKDGPPDYHVDVSKIPNAKPVPLPLSRYGNPTHYKVLGKTYHVLHSAKGYNQRGIASWYGTKFNGALTSTREPYDMLGMTAASPVLPIPCFARVTNLENGRSIIVKVNDRGPFAPNRIMDLSYVAAAKLGYIGKGTAMVQVQTIDEDHPNAPAVAPIHHPEIYLQIGAFRDLANAQAQSKRSQTIMNRRTQIRVTYINNRPMYHVRVGPLNVNESDKLLLELQHHGYANAITVIG